MENTVTNRQIAFIFILTITTFSSVNIPKLMAQSAGTGSWITVLLTSLLFAMAAWAWAKLNASYEGKTLFEYGGELISKAGAYIIAAFFSLYFLTVLVDLTITMTALLKANFLPNTPVWFSALAAIPVIGFVAYKGVTNAARLIEIYGVIFVVIALAVHIVMALQGKLTNILPLFDAAETGKYLAAVKDAIYPFLGVEVLAVLPFSAKNKPKAPRTAALTMLLIGLFYVLVVESSIMMVGADEIVHYNYPLIVAIRQVELPAFKVFQRVDILYLTVGLLGLLAGMSVVYLGVAELVCRMLPKARRGVVVLVVGAAAYAAFFALHNVVDIDKILVNIITKSGILTAFVVPLALLAISKVKHHAMGKAA